MSQKCVGDRRALSGNLTIRKLYSYKTYLSSYYNAKFTHPYAYQLSQVHRFSAPINAPLRTTVIDRICAYQLLVFKRLYTACF